MFDAAIAVMGSSFERAPWGWGVLVMLGTIMLRLRPIMTRLATEREVNLLTGRAADNAELKKRVDDLEHRLDFERSQHEAERVIDRHRINNLTQCLDALLLLLEMAPEKAAQHVERIKEMRVRQTKMESVEKTAVQVAGVVANTEKGPPQ